MSLRTCICCDEPMAKKGNALSRHPKMCASCSSLSDGMPESNMSSYPNFDGKMLVEENFHPVMAEPIAAFVHS